MREMVTPFLVKWLRFEMLGLSQNERSQRDIGERYHSGVEKLTWLTRQKVFPLTQLGEGLTGQSLFESR